MKTLKIFFVLIIGATLLSSCGKNEITLNKKGDTYYIEGSQKLYTGRCLEYQENGEKLYEGTIENGKKQGLWIWYHSNGTKRLEENFTNGILNGTRKGLDESGKEIFAVNYSQGYEI